MRTVEQTLANKSRAGIHSISPNATVFEALQRMAAQNVGALIVQDGTEVVGIVSERDYARKMVLRGRASAATPVSAIMSNSVVTVSPQETTQQCLHLMTQDHIRHLPVMESCRLVGLVSIGDLVKEVILEQQDLIDHLQKYIRGE